MRADLVSIDPQRKLHGIGFSQWYAESGFAGRYLTVISCKRTIGLALIRLGIIGYVEVVTHTNSVIGKVRIKIRKAQSF